MIKFFRKIRQQLLIENKFNKYLLYALGEIILVVIGILIALQVNNWNESRKIRQVEISILKELTADLNFSVREIEDVGKANQVYLTAYKKIYSYLVEDLAYEQVLDTAFSYLDIWVQPYLPSITYENIKSRGLDIIQNDSLKRHIVNIYEFHIKALIEDMGQWEWSYNQNTTQRMMVGNVRRDINGMNVAVPNDFENLKNDEEFINFLSILIVIRSDNIKMSNDTKSAIEELIRHIDKELDD